MTLGFRVGVPGLGIRVSTRGVRASVGPRIARVHVGTGRTRVSTGLGPFFASSALGGSSGRRRPPAGRSRGTVSPYRLAAEQRSAERAQVDADRLASIRALQATLDELVTVHRGAWPAANRPVIARLRVVDREAVVKHAREVCLRGIGLLQRQQRREASERADLLAAQYIDAEDQRLDAERARVQVQADAWWQQLLDNDEDTTCAVLNAAFADNPAGGVAVGVDGANASVVIRQLDLSALPTHRPDLTATGRPTLKKMTQRERHDVFLDSLTSNVAATLREAFAVAPGLTAITVCALTRFERSQRVGPVLFGRWERQAVEAVRWGTHGDAHSLVFDRHTDLHLDRTATGQPRTLSTQALPALEGVMRLLREDEQDDSDDGDDDGSAPSSEAPVLRPRSFEEWLSATTQNDPGAQPGDLGEGAPDPARPAPGLLQLRRGEAVPLQIGEFDPPVLFEVTTAHDAPDVDLSVLLLDEHGHTRTDRDFVFYNAPTSPFGAVRLTPPERDRDDAKRAVLVDIGALRHEGVERLAVIVSSDAPLLEHGPGLRVALLAGQSQRRDLPLPEEPGLTAGVVAELYLRRSLDGAEWRVRGLGQGWTDGLAGVVRSYGVAVDD